MLRSSLPSITPVSATPVFSSPWIDFLVCVLKSYEFPLLIDLNSQEKLIQSARGKLDIGPIYLLRQCNFLKFTKSKSSLDVKRCIELEGAVGCENRNHLLACTSSAQWFS